MARDLLSRVSEREEEENAMLTSYSPLDQAGSRASPRSRRDVTFRSSADIHTVIARIHDRMTAEGYSEDDVFAVRLALEEALVNAVKHGHAHDATKEVHVQFDVDADRVLVLIQDQGEGFDLDQVADPLTLENIEKPGGRGLLLMRSLMTWVRFNRKGNRVVLCKHRSG